MAANLEEIRSHLKDELRPGKGERGKYICPICGSGDHGANSTAAFSIMPDGIHGHCFSCGFHGDIFDLVAARDGISAAEATKALIEKYQPGTATGRRSSPAEDFRKPAAEAPAAPEAEPERKSYLYRIEQARAALPGSPGEAYLKARGITAETMARFMVGYEPDHYFPGLKEKREAIIFPYDQAASYWGARTLGPRTDGCFDKPKSAEAGPEPVFNAAALYSGEPVFVVESQLDVMTIAQEGGRAVAIGGSGINKLKNQIEKRAPAGVLILNFDNDEAGERDYVQAGLMLTEQNIPYIRGNVQGSAKDPNDLLQADPEELRANIEKALADVGAELAAKQAEEKEKQLEARNSESTAGYIEHFLDVLRESKSAPAIPTGFSGLDKLLDGGFYPGLYIIGAITSLGKSTFTLQIADQVAAQGRDVLCFNLEMARNELIAKSVSRLTFQIATETKQPLRRARSTRDVLASRKWKYFTKDDMALMAAALDRYGETSAPHIWHYEGVGDIGVEYIKAEVERHIAITGNLPLVIVDYLQILATPDLKMSDKQAVDKNVLELKRLSRDKGIPVFAISSLNRDNYLNPINNAAFKESGAVEYSSDCLIGLQFLGMDYEEGEADKAREKRIRTLVKEQKARGNKGEAEEIQLKILKNRNGKAGISEVLLYTPRYNHYQEKSDFTEVDGDAAGIPSEWAEDQQQEPGKNQANTATAKKKRKPI